MTHAVALPGWGFEHVCPLCGKPFSGWFGRRALKHWQAATAQDGEAVVERLRRDGIEHLRKDCDGRFLPAVVLSQASAAEAQKQAEQVRKAFGLG
jgi:hypothetical protein